MPTVLANPWRSTGLPDLDMPMPRVDPAPVLELLRWCPKAEQTPLVDSQPLAEAIGVDRLWVKDETQRLGLGSFKALGAAYVIADRARMRSSERDGWPDDVSGLLDGETYVTASSGNHGMSVAAGSRVFGAAAVVVLAEGVPEAFATRLRAFGAEVVRAGSDYDESMAEAVRLAEDRGWSLLTDSSWPDYTEIPLQVMEGYLVMGAEAADEVEAISEAPTHIFLQAGVGGMAASTAAYARHRWGDQPVIVVVEGDRAACLMASVREGRAVRSDGPPSNMGRLDAKEPSILALAALAQDADFFITISDEEAAETTRLLGEHGLTTTPSGAAGLSAVQHAGPNRAEIELDRLSRVLCFATEGLETAI